VGGGGGLVVTPKNFFFSSNYLLMLFYISLFEKKSNSLTKRTSLCQFINYLCCAQPLARNATVFHKINFPYVKEISNICFFYGSQSFLNTFQAEILVDLLLFDKFLKEKEPLFSECEMNFAGSPMLLS
jgi:hypothetical protein